MNQRFSVCVYCGSRPGALEVYQEHARRVGQWIGHNGGELVYGGGLNGLMGILADAAAQAGASVIGVIPKSMVEREWARNSCDELHIVNTMHERKQMMMERADVLLALPGGIGTFEEFFEAWAWRQLHFHDMPIGLLNTAGYYNPLLGMFDTAVNQGFLGQNHLDLIKVDNQPESLLTQLVGSIKPNPANALQNL